MNLAVASTDAHEIDRNQCVASITSNRISEFETIGMGWISEAWIIDEWGCGFPQLNTVRDRHGAAC